MYGLTRKEMENEIKYVEDKINFYTNKIYNKKLKMEKKRQELKSSLDNDTLTEEQLIDLIGDILRIDYKIEELKKDIKLNYEYMKELQEELK